MFVIESCTLHCALQYPTAIIPGYDGENDIISAKLDMASLTDTAYNTFFLYAAS